MKNLTRRIFKNKYLTLYTVVSILAVGLLCFNTPVSAKKHTKPHSKRYATKVREILLSQQLFVVEISPVKGSKPKDKLVNFKAELRDAFMVICYDGDKTITELNWTMCPNGKCPIAKTYNWGTPEYNQVDTLMREGKASTRKLEARIRELKKQAGK